jgi:hypothetical protein
MTPMNQRKAIAANGTRFRLQRINGSTDQRAALGIGLERLEAFRGQGEAQHHRRGQKQQGEGDACDRPLCAGFARSLRSASAFRWSSRRGLCAHLWGR